MMYKEELQGILMNHKRWLEGDDNCECADLSYDDLSYDDLSYTDLRNVDLRHANLKSADLRMAILRGANLIGANIDCSAWPLWCGSAGVKVDLRIVYQLLAHVACLVCEEPEFEEIKKAIMPYALKSHIASDLGLEEGENVKPIKIRKIVNKLRYDTEKSTLIAHDGPYTRLFLYKTPNGRYFYVEKIKFENSDEDLDLRPIDIENAIRMYESLRVHVVKIENAFPGVEVEDA